MVVVDTSAWFDFLKQPSSAVGQEVARLLRANQVLMVGMVLAEVLHTQRGQQFADLHGRLNALPYLETGRAIWHQAAELAALLRSQCRITPLSDLVIDAQALEGGYELFTTDAHFERVPGLRLHEAAQV